MREKDRIPERDFLKCATFWHNPTHFLIFHAQVNGLISEQFFMQNSTDVRENINPAILFYCTRSKKWENTLSIKWLWLKSVGPQRRISHYLPWLFMNYVLPPSSRWGINYVLLEVKWKNNDYCMSSRLKQDSIDGHEVLQTLTLLAQIIST